MTDRLNDVSSAAWDAANRKALRQTELTYGDHVAARLKDNDDDGFQCYSENKPITALEMLEFYGGYTPASLKRPAPPTGYRYVHPETPSNGTNVSSDGSTASYYELPAGAGELQELIAYKDMNAQVGEIFRECYRYGQAAHCDKLRGAKKMKFYIDAEIKRLEGLA